METMSKGLGCNIFVKIFVILICCKSYITSWPSFQPNVVLLIFDDLRPAIGAYGDKLARTPYLDKFVNESHYFTYTYSQQALCAPSRNSMLTSRRPDTLRLYDFNSYWRTFVGNFTTLPQYFKENGYFSYSIGKVFHPGKSSNYTDDYPISWSDRTYHPKTERYKNTHLCSDKHGILRNNLMCPVDLKTQPFNTLPDIESVTEAIHFINSHDKSLKPYFLALGFHKPHINFHFPKQFLSKFDLKLFFNTTKNRKPFDMPNVAWNPYTDIRSRDDIKVINVSFPYGPIDESASARIRQAYYACVSYVDYLFGKFIHNVDKRNTIVVVTSDHGWSLGERGEWAKYSNVDVALRVPLIIRSPEFDLYTSKSINTINELVDLFPTIVDLAHLPQIPHCRSFEKSRIIPVTCTEGKSLFPQLKGIVGKNKYQAFSQYPRPELQPSKTPNSDKPKLGEIRVMGYSIRTNKFRYTLWVRFHSHNFTKDWFKIFGEEMYDHHFKTYKDMNLVGLRQFNGIRMRLKHKLMLAFK